MKANSVIKWQDFKLAAPARLRVAPPLFLLLAVLTVPSCAEIVPRLELRDDYMFKRFFQPNRVVSEVERDALGNPILPKSAESEQD